MAGVAVGLRGTLVAGQQAGLRCGFAERRDDPTSRGPSVPAHAASISSTSAVDAGVAEADGSRRLCGQLQAAES